MYIPYWVTVGVKLSEDAWTYKVKQYAVLRRRSPFARCFSLCSELRLRVADPATGCQMGVLKIGGAYPKM